MKLAAWQKLYADPRVDGDALDKGLKQAQKADPAEYDRTWRPHLIALADGVRPRRWRPVEHSFIIDGSPAKLEAAGQPYYIQAVGFGAKKLKPPQIKALAQSPLLARVDQLDVGGAKLGDKELPLLLASPHLTRLRGLTASNVALTDAGAKAIASAPALARLSSLDVSHTKVGFTGLAALASLSTLTALDVSGTKVGAHGAEALANGAAKLRRLRASVTGLDDASIARIAAAFPDLDELELAGNDFTAKGYAALAALPNLTTLSIGDCGVAGIAKLGTSKSLRSLDLHGSKLGDAGLAALVDTPLALTYLAVGNTAIADLGVRALIAAKPLRKLRGLSLSYNKKISDAAIVDLANTFTELTVLHVADTGIGDAGVIALSRSPLAKTLIKLDLGRPKLGPEGEAARTLLETAIRKRRAQ